MQRKARIRRLPTNAVEISVGANFPLITKINGKAYQYLQNYGASQDDIVYLQSELRAGREVEIMLDRFDFKT
jgi:hypothetical protein